MAHELESMFYVSNEENGRFVPWHRLGTPVQDAPTSEEALKLAGLDWEVLSNPVFTERGTQIPNYVANTRSSDNSVLGIVTGRYKIVQNKDAFAFTDELIGNGVRYETAGSLRNGKSIFLLAKMPTEKVLGDDVDPYLCFTNTHDGTGAVRVCCTNVRVCCANTLNLALSTAERSWACRHTGRIEDKLAEARETLELANSYIDKFKEYADRAVDIKIDEEKTFKLLEELFPITTDMSDREASNKRNARNNFLECTYAIDLSPFYGTLWGLINAASDYNYHRESLRKTPTFQEARMKEAITGSSMLDKIVEMYPVGV